MIDEQKTSLDVSFCRTKAPYAAVYYHGGFLPEVGHLFNSQNLRRDADGFLSDLSRYTGIWHEIARLPMWAQRHCVRSTAEYRLLERGG